MATKLKTGRFKWPVFNLTHLLERVRVAVYPLEVRVLDVDVIQVGTKGGCGVGIGSWCVCNRAASPKPNACCNYDYRDNRIKYGFTHGFIYWFVELVTAVLVASPAKLASATMACLTAS